MKLSMFSNQGELNEWAYSMAECHRKGLADAQRKYDEACQGIGKEAFLSQFRTASQDVKEAEWQDHLKWLKGAVSYEKKQIRKYENMIK